MNLAIENAMFKYPQLPKTADNIQLIAELHYDGIVKDNTYFNLKKFHIDFGGNPVDITFSVKTPFSDMNLSGSLKTDIELASFSDVISMENTEIKGKINSDIYFNGNMLTIEKGEYENFIVDGSLFINNFIYSTRDLPRTKINNSEVVFTPRFVDLRNFDMEFGRSDIKLKGKIENFLSYVFKKGTVTGNLVLNSDLIDLNELITGSSSEAEETKDTTQLQAVEIPDRIVFNFTSKIGKIFYDKLVIDNFEGNVLLRDKKLILDKVSLNTLDGSILLKGEYNTQIKERPAIEFLLDIRDIDVPMAAKSFAFLEKLVPIAKNVTGKVSINTNYYCTLDNKMNPILNTIQAKGKLQSKEIGILKSNTFVKLGETLKTKAFDNITLQDVNISFEIKDGNIYVDPFETKIKNNTLLFGGVQSIDQTINYTARIIMPKGELGKEAEALVNSLATQLIRTGVNFQMGDNIIYDVKITGKLFDPKFLVNLVTQQTGKTLKDEVRDRIKGEIDLKKTEIKESINLEAQRIIEEAEKRSTEIRSKAQEAAQVVRNEANAKADQIEKQAKNPIEKRAAEITARKIREEGEAKAQQIIKNADAEAEKIIQQAKERASKLTQ